MMGSTLYVANFTHHVTEEQLRELFSSYGEVKGVRILPDRGSGLVEMSDAWKAKIAKETLNDSDFKGHTLKVDLVDRPSFLTQLIKMMPS